MRGSYSITTTTSYSSANCPLVPPHHNHPRLQFRQFSLVPPQQQQQQ